LESTARKVRPFGKKKQVKFKENKTLAQRMKRDWRLYVLLALPIIYLLVFKYYPMIGAQIAFKKYNMKLGIWGSEWIGFENFTKFFNDYNFTRVLRNTLTLSLYGLIAGFPLPIIFALSLNYTKNERFKRTVQMITYAPHFISTVVIVGMLFAFFSTRTGIFNQLLVDVGLDEIDFFAKASTFPHMYVWSQIWQSLGFSSIIYIATLSGIDPSLHEAAIVDGANKIQRMIHIDLPGIMPTAIVLLILNAGRILNVGFEKALLMQNPVNLPTSEIISTYVYKVSLQSAFPQFAYATAIGLFQSLVSVILIVSVNKFAQKFSDSSLF